MDNTKPGSKRLRQGPAEALSRLSGLDLLLILIITTAWWLLTRPYRGIWHDGIFYTVQALRRLHPEAYAQDVFFLYGSQDDYSIYSRLQAWLSSILGMEHAFLFLTLAGAALWLYALLRLLKRWLSPTQLVFSVILVLSADAHYGGFGVFTYGEGFASPRIFSEALVLLSLSLWFEGRRVFAGFALTGAAVLHLLMALAGAGVFIWSILSARVARTTGLWLALLVAGLLSMQLSLWIGLSPQLDPLWAELVAQRSPFIFPHLWESGDWLRLVLDALLLWLASRHLNGEIAKLAGWVLAVLFLGVLLSLAAGLLGVQLAVAAQFLRVQWLSHLLAISFAVPLCLSLWNTENFHDRFLAVGIGSSLVFPFNMGGLVLPVVFGLTQWAKCRLGAKPLPAGLKVLVLVGIPLASVASWLTFLLPNLILVQSFSETPVWWWVLRQPPIALALPVAVYTVFSNPEWRQASLWAYGFVLLVIGVLNWDARKPWRMHERPERSAAISQVSKLIPDRAVVYWEKGVFVNPEHRMEQRRGFEQSWFWLKRAHYASFDQAAGNVFYRQTAIEIDRRIAHLRKWGFRDADLDWNEHKKIPEKFHLTDARLRGVCSDPILDFVITDTRLASASLSFQDPLTERKFSVYDCQKLRVS